MKQKKDKPILDPIIPIVVNCCEVCKEPLEGLRFPYGGGQLKGSTVCVLCFLNPRKRLTIH